MYLIIHETSTSNLLNILKSNVLYKSSKIYELGLTTSQGSPKRRLAKDPTVSLRDADFGAKYDEVDGVYFRLWMANNPIRTSYGGDCVLVFSKKILEQYKFVINTEENFGFCIADDGVISKAHFSGEEGMTVTDLAKLDLLNEYRFDPCSSEILIMGDVELNTLRCVFVKRRLVSARLTRELAVRNVQLYMLP